MVQCSAAALRAAEGDEEGGGRVKISGHVEDSAERLDSGVTHLQLQDTEVYSFAAAEAREKGSSQPRDGKVRGLRV
mgnify:CR=1 FL=1